MNQESLPWPLPAVFPAENEGGSLTLPLSGRHSEGEQAPPIHSEY